MHTGHCPVPDLLPKMAQPTVADLGAVGAPDMSGAHRTFRCPLLAVGSATCPAQIARPRDSPAADESFVVIRFAQPKGIDFQYLLNMIHDSFMSRANTIVVPGGKMELAMQLIFTPFIWRMMEKRKRLL